MTGAAVSDLLRRLASRAAAWPPLPRDLAAASLALWSVCLGELLILLLPGPAEALLALPGVMLAWWALGRASAAFALLAAQLAVDLPAGDRGSALAGAGPREVLCLLAPGGALVASGIAARAWARTRERRCSSMPARAAGSPPPDAVVARACRAGRDTASEAAWRSEGGT